MEHVVINDERFRQWLKEMSTTLSNVEFMAEVGLAPRKKEQTCMRDPVITSMNCCARCQKEHKELSFNKLTHPIIGENQTGTMDLYAGPRPVLFTHWALCPENGEPILMIIVERSS